MYIFFVFVVNLLVITSISYSLLPIEEMFHHYRSGITKNRLEVITGAVMERYQESPTTGLIDPVNLSTVSGYEYLRSSYPGQFQYAASASVVDPVWTFSRLGIWFESPVDAVGPSNYPESGFNSCGSGSLFVAQSWCGRPNSIWARIETRESISASLLAEKQRLVRVMRKFVQRYSADQKFTLLPNGSLVTLPALVGYAGNASNCSGFFVYNKIPFSCEDLFNHWGAPIALNFVNTERMALVSRTRIQNSAGGYIRLAEEINLE